MIGGFFNLKICIVCVWMGMGCFWGNVKIGY